MFDVSRKRYKEAFILLCFTSYAIYALVSYNYFCNELVVRSN